MVDMPPTVGRQVAAADADAVQDADPGAIEQREHVLGAGT